MRKTFALLLGSAAIWFSGCSRSPAPEQQAQPAGTSTPQSVEQMADAGVLTTASTTTQTPAPPPPTGVEGKFASKQGEKLIAQMTSLVTQVESSTTYTAEQKATLAEAQEKFNAAMRTANAATSKSDYNTKVLEAEKIYSELKQQFP